MRPERFELPTYCSGGNRSIHLSYGRSPVDSVYMGVFRASTLGFAGWLWDPVRATIRWRSGWKPPAIAKTLRPAKTSKTNSGLGRHRHRRVRHGRRRDHRLGLRDLVHRLRRVRS